MACNAGPKIVNDGLVLALDAGNTKSYPGSGITYVGGTSESSDSSSFTLNGLQAGDLVLYFGARDVSDLNTPTGESWTAIPGLVTQPNNNSNPSSAAFYVFASGTSVTASGLNISSGSVHVMIAFRNVDSTNPFDVNATEVSGSGLPDPPSITPVTNNSMIVAVGIQDDEDIATSISPPTGYTTALNMDSQGGANDAGLGGATIMTAYKLLATAAAEDPGAFTSSNGNAGDANKGISIALREDLRTTWTDLSGKGNNGTLTNGPTFDSGNVGSIVFDGMNDYAGTSSNTDFLFGTEEFAMEWWEYFTGNNAYQGHIGVFENANIVPNIWTYNGTFRSRIGLSASWADISMSPLSNQWAHYVMTGISGNIRFYQNGELKDTKTWDWSATSSTSDFAISGTPGWSLGNYAMSGKISAVRVYKGRSLSTAEVQQNFNALRGRFGI